MQLAPDEIGVIKPEPVRRWLEAKTKLDAKYSKTKKRVEKKRAKEMLAMMQEEERGGEEAKEGERERPPPSALFGRMKREEVAAAAGGGIGKSSLGLRFWSLMGHSHDEKTVSFSIFFSPSWKELEPDCFRDGGIDGERRKGRSESRGG